VLSNEEMTPDKFFYWLINAKSATIIFEARDTSNDWLQRAIEAGHDARLFCAKLVSTVRQNQKTDKNDVLVII
jgi:transposase